VTDYFFLSETFCAGFKKAFFHRYGTSEKVLLEEAVSFAYEKICIKHELRIFTSSGETYNWLFLTAQRKLFRETKRWNKNAKISELSFELQTEADVGFEEHDFFRKLVGSSSKKNAVVMELILEGMNINEIAEQLHEKPDTIKHRLQRGGKKLRGEFGI
jgi:DNA-directed RNA polymerase specialized sigma24 family protein